MTASEIESLAAALTSAIRKSGLSAAAQQSKRPAAVDDRKDQIEKKRSAGIIFSTTTAIKSLGTTADLAASTLRDLSKSALRTVIGLSQFTTALEDSSKRTKGKIVSRAAVKPTKVSSTDAAMERAMAMLKDAERTEERERIGRETQRIRAEQAKERKDKARQEKAQRVRVTPPGKPEASDIIKPIKIDASEVINTENKLDLDEFIGPPKKQLEWKTGPEFIVNKFLKPIADDLDKKIRARTKAFSKFEQDEAAADENRREAIEHNVRQIGAFATKSMGILWRTSLDSLNIMFGTLAQRGYGTSDSFSSLAVSSARAGMSIQEYTEMMDGSMAVVSRSSSFADFENKLRVGTDALKEFGIAGPEATKAVASLMTSSTQLGIPQDQLKTSIEAQMSAFRQLQKTTGLTITDFARLSAEVSSYESVQTELAALEPAQREARRAALTQQYAYAKSLNISERAQASFTQAVIEQRRSTVKTRYNQAGRLMQAGGLVGMGADQIEEMRKLSLNRYKNDDEQKRYMDLLGKLGTGMEQVQQQGGPGSQYQMDTMKELLDSNGMTSAMDAAMAIKLGKESGKTGNADMSHNVSELDKNLAGLFAWVKGWGSNPIGAAAISLTSSFVALASSIKFGLIQMAPSLGTVIGDRAGYIIARAMSGTAHGVNSDTHNPIPAGTGADPGKPQKANKWIKGAAIAGGALEVGMAAYGAYSVYSDMNKKEAEEGGPTKETKEKKAEATGNGILGAAGGIALAVAPFLGPAAPLAVGFGLVASALNMFGVGGSVFKMFVSNETAVEKNTRETNKLTKEMNEARKDEAGAEVIDASSLVGLGSAVHKSGIASSLVSEEEVAKAKPVDPKVVAQNLKETQDNVSEMLEAQARVDAAAAYGKPSKASPKAIDGAAIAMPTTVTPTRVNPTTVNTADEVAEKKAAAAPLALGKNGVDDQATLLQQQTSVMQQQTDIMQKHLDATTELARTLAIRPTQQSTEYLYRRATA